jgi:endonuclease/exonuclease/phosphatase family metal-dependent hydrolase
MKLKVLSYNIHKGFNAANRKFILRKIREAIRSVHADLVLLQEVQGHHDEHRKEIKDWPEQPQFEFLAHEIWPHFAYGKNAVYSAGHHGNAILSKHPIGFCENINISTNRFEKRGLLHGVIQLPKIEKPLHAICLHLGLFENSRQSQIAALCRRIDSHVTHSDPLVIGGDFNDWRVKATSLLEKKLEVDEVFSKMTGAHARSFPSWLPALQLDRIYVRGSAIRTAKVLAGKPWNELSDHLALFTELEIS